MIKFYHIITDPEIQPFRVREVVMAAYYFSLGLSNKPVQFLREAP